MFKFKKIPFMVLCVCCAFAAEARWQKGDGIKAAQEEAEQAEELARSGVTDSSVSSTAATTCPTNEITAQLNQTCAASYCTSVTMMEQSLASAGYDLNGLSASCQAEAYKQIASRIENVYGSFKIECDRMNTEYTSAIDEWKATTNKCQDDLVSMEKKKKTATGVAVGAGVIAAGLGTWVAVDKLKNKNEVPVEMPQGKKP